MIIGWDELGKVTEKQWRYLLARAAEGRVTRGVWLHTEPRERTMNLPVCQCGRVMTVARNGVRALVHDERGLEYQLWAMDEFKCPDDGRTILANAGAKPIAEHYQPNFHTEIKRAGALLRKVYHGPSPTPLANLETITTTIAKMHAAAVGEVTGPRRGVVEDVEDLKAAHDHLEAEVARLTGLLSKTAE